MTVAVDFAPGLHGHFLEYVINRYLFGVPCGPDTIFQSSGAVHAINVDLIYQENKIADRGHYSSFNNPLPGNTTHIVFIKHDPKLDFILLTNIYYRCHPDSANVADFNINEIEKLHKYMMSGDANTPGEFRANWFAKLYERHFQFTEKYPNTSLPVFDFDYASFFSLPAFLCELKRLGKFLNTTFKFDRSLSVLWQDFISRNQGYHLHSQAQKILNAIYNAESKPIPDDWKLQACLNCEIAKTFDLYDGILYNSNDYPTNTNDVYNHIIDHIQSFDNRFK